MSNESKPNSPSDGDLEKAYYQAVTELQPKAEVDEAIRLQAHSQLRKGRDWASVPMWARAASVIGVAVVGWWLWQPDLIEWRPQTDNTIVENQVPMEVATEDAMAAAPTSVEPKSPPPSSADALESQFAAAEVAKEQQAAEQVQQQAREAEQALVARHKLEQAQRQAERQHSEQLLKFSFCLQYKLARRDDLVISNDLPDGTDSGSVLSGPSIEWQEQPWQLVEIAQTAYLVRAEGDNWQVAKVPAEDFTVCNLHR
ncbi:hypothetical protein GCM10011369_22050 [Neiella marina]|uniref:Uncharacterized protein n=1 Tax=Neiella marina TaxID=508461 RepID=A0A8J2U5R8_9GAMM|nr:hypothetical protein [Neiella marina]GGA79684.1 hypothetical protein GCM10011369_22050 [Neiella marina]